MCNKEKIGFWKKWRQLRQSREIIYVVSQECVGCRRCAKICRHRVLSMIAVENKTYAAACRQERCSKCCKCIAVCPEKAIRLVKVIDNK
ncbi:MAG: 4Fe-4S dicluster domain-containing protein [Prevotellaceae bacterium]|jgi:NAD-dependent dihydropyrimidine dehydrogenase PreA subunit|nr:4Fe-4S dicluster domain-containing protein [Prevotellaceae bacterium]